MALLRRLEPQRVTALHTGQAVTNHRCLQLAHHRHHFLTYQIWTRNQLSPHFEMRIQKIRYSGLFKEETSSFLEKIIKLSFRLLICNALHRP